MDSNLKLFTYQTSLLLQNEEQQFSAGFCLSKAPFNELQSAYGSFLHPKEQNYFATMQYPKRQQSFLLGRYCAKVAATAFTNEDDLTKTCIENGIFQQPFVHHKNHPNLQVSISHTDILGAALIFPEAHPMAIDIETICDSKSETISTQLTKTEQEISNAEIKTLTTLWTIKEALSKVLKCGFTVPFELLETENFNIFDSFATSHFKNFSQYQAMSFEVGDSICTLVFPKRTKFILDIPAIQQQFSKKIVRI
jgi:phosphopantetheinyl transferase